MPRRSSVADVRAALKARQKADRALAKHLRALPPGVNDLDLGKERKAAVRACLEAGLSQGELSRLMGLSRQRVSQLVSRGER